MNLRQYKPNEDWSKPDQYEDWVDQIQPRTPITRKEFINHCKELGPGELKPATMKYNWETYTRWLKKTKEKPTPTFLKVKQKKPEQEPKRPKPKPMPRLCQVEDCYRIHSAKGFCHMHYLRWKRETYEIERRCKVEGCDRPHDAKGYCGMHYRRWKSTGSTSK